MGFNQKINDSMNNMSRSVTTQMMKDAPPDLTYVYIGPVDEKTRDFCLDAASQGALTEAQILELGGEYAESLVSGGGINCRHNWELASDDIQSQFHRGGEAQKIIDAKAPVDILSPKMAGKSKTVKEATSWAESNIKGVQKANYKDMPLDEVNIINKELNILQNKYGKLGNLDEIIVVKANNKFSAKMKNGHQLQIASDTRSSWIKREVASGIMPTKPSIAGLIDHEIGHALTPAIFNFDTGKGILTPFGKRLDDFFTSNANKIKSEISDYAASARHEFVAEAFAMREAKKAPKWVIDWLESEGM